jgi:FkbM family methyltransferase
MTDPILEFAERYLRADMDAIDVGANQGLYTFPFAASSRHVLAFEPNPQMAQLLRDKKAEHSNVTIIEAAVSDWIGETTFYIDTRPGLGAAASSLNVLSELAQTARPMQVSVTTIDEHVRRGGLCPSIAKIDVEGHEPAVVRGMKQTLHEFRPALIFEFWESWWSRGYRATFEYLNPMYRMIRLGSGEDAYAYYTTMTGDATVDIGCIPR